MRTWIKRTLFGLFGASLVLGVTACGHRHGGEGWQMSATDHANFKDKMIDRVSGKLDLTPDQKTRLGVLADKLQEQRAALVAGSANPRTELQALVAGEKFDRTKAQAMVAGKTAALNNKSPEVIAAMGDFYDSLKPDQQARLREFMQKRRGWWHRG